MFSPSFRGAGMRCCDWAALIKVRIPRAVPNSQIITTYIYLDHLGFIDLDWISRLYFPVCVPLLLSSFGLRRVYLERAVVGPRGY